MSKRDGKVSKQEEFDFEDEMFKRKLENDPIGTMSTLRSDFKRCEDGHSVQLRTMLMQAYQFALVANADSSVREKFYADPFFQDDGRKPKDKNVLRIVMRFLLGAATSGARYDRACNYENVLRAAFAENAAPEKVAELLSKSSIDDLYRQAVDEKKKEPVSSPDKPGEKKGRKEPVSKTKKVALKKTFEFLEDDDFDIDDDDSDDDFSQDGNDDPKLDVGVDDESDDFRSHYGRNPRLSVDDALNRLRALSPQDEEKPEPLVVFMSEKMLAKVLRLNAGERASLLLTRSDDDDDVDEDDKFVCLVARRFVRD